MDLIRYMPAVLSGGSTISPDEVDLGASTVASVVITGIAVVFIGLILLILFVTVYGAVFKAINKHAAEKARQKELAAIEASKPGENEFTPKPPPAPEVEDGIEEETVAVIMAAIAAMSAAKGKKLMVRSVKAAKPRRSAWASAGIADNTRPFY